VVKAVALMAGAVAVTTEAVAVTVEANVKNVAQKGKIELPGGLF